MSGLLAHLQLLRPAWLWALLALPLIAWGWHLRRRRGDVWRKVVDPRLLPHLLERGPGSSGAGGLVLACIAWTLAVLAMAGPSWRSGEQPLVAGGMPMVIALDLSSATLAGDLPPSRLLQARARLAQLLQARNGEPTALVVYAQDAFVVAPLTTDTGNIVLFLDALAPDVMPVDGSDAARAIELASHLLARGGHARGDILLLAGHADGHARVAAAEAAAKGSRISVMGMGTAAGVAYQRRDGTIAQARLDAASLRGVATAGGGQYHDWNSDLDVLASPSPMSGGDSGDGGTGVRTRLDDGYWLLLPVMLLALFAFRRGTALAALAACMVALPLLSPPAHAADEGGLWRRADQARHARMREGIAAYRSGDLDAALQAWHDLPGADAAYNRGNALARQGRLEEALEAYDEALRQRPDMADAIANRETVEAALQRRPPAGENTPRTDGESPQEPPGQANPGAEVEAQGAPAQDDEGEPAQDAGGRQGDTSRAQQREDGSTPSQPDAETEAGQQRAADEALRQQMQQALQQQGGAQATDGERVEGDPDRPESEAERERRQANEAWLRRIPDDPGGLLRAKFKLEHERRQGAGGER